MNPFSARTMAVLPNPQAVSPAGIFPCFRAISTICCHRNRMSRTPRTASAKTTCWMSQVSSASSWISFPPVLSMESRSPPAAAPRSKSSNI